MQLTIVFVWLCLVITATAQNDHIMTCYVDASMQKLPFLVHPLLCTHVIYSTAYIDNDSTFKTQNSDHDYFLRRTLKDRDPILKILLGVEVNQTRLELMSQNQTTLDNFISSTLNYVKEKNYDGLDLTWMVPKETLSNTQTLTSLFKALREWIEKDSDLTVNKALLVSVSLLDSICLVKQTLAQYVDFISLLPLSPNIEWKKNDSTVQCWQDQGIKPEMLILALPALVRWSPKSQNEINPTIVDINPAMKVEKTYGPGLIMADQICQTIKSGQKELNFLTNLKSVQSHGEEVARMLKKTFGGVGVVFVNIAEFGKSIGDGCTQTEIAILESKVDTVFPLRTHLRHNHHHCHHHYGHRQHGDHQHRHHHHRHHHHRHHHHGLHKHKHRHHKHLHHDHPHHGHGHHQRGHRAHFQHGQH